MKIDDLLTALVYLIVFYLVFFIGKLVNDLLHRGYDLTHELVQRDNPAIALGVAGYYLGLVLAIGGAVAGPSNGLVNDLIDLGIYGLLAILLLNLSWFVCDRLLLYKFRTEDELIRDQNPGTGAVVFGVNVASGVIVFGAVTGQGGNIWTAMAFWAVGQALLLAAGWVYNRIIPYDIHEVVEQDNIAAGVGFAGAIVSMGIVIGLSSARDFTRWSDDLPDFVLAAAVGLVMLPVVRFLTDKILLPTVKLSDEIAVQERPNVGAAYIEACSYIAAAFVVSWCV
jgi:uncharacterized membrane protein YjfL (UPF0719 family)